MCSLALAFSCLPAYGIENAADSLGRDPGEPAASGLQGDNSNVGEEDNREPQGVEYREADELVPDNWMSLMGPEDDSEENDSGDAPPYVKIKSDSNWVQWYDRIDIPEEFQNDCKNFYDRLVEACDNDGDRDFLIEDKYIDGTITGASYKDEGFYSEGRRSGIKVGSFEYELDSNLNIINSSDYNKKIRILVECAYAVRAAFDRDHPEVFWLNGDAALFYYPGYPEDDAEVSAPGNKRRVYNLFLAIGGIKSMSDLQSAKYDNMRIPSFTSESEIKYSISLREARVQELLAYVGVEYDPISAIPDSMTSSLTSSVEYEDAEKVRFFNRWLTFNNGYNTQNPYTLIDYCPLAFECLSALSGKCGTTGPVCEGYSRAFKTLCDACGISCVITDGMGDGSSHMWNYVSINEKWYGVDVTWNDPGAKAQKISKRENEDYLLKGEGVFERSHEPENRHFSKAGAFPGLSFTNGPQLERESLDLSSLSSFDYMSVEDFSEVDTSIFDNDITLCNSTRVGPYEYTGKAITPVPLEFFFRRTFFYEGKEISTITRLHYGDDYTIDYVDNVNAGTAYMKLSGTGSYFGSKTISFAINPQPIKVGTVEVADAVYTGKARIPKPKVTVKNSGCRLGSEYTVGVSYSNNVNAGMGKATVTIKGLGNFGGSVSVVKNFLIYPKKASLKTLSSKRKSFVVKWNKATKKWATGYHIRYSTNSKFKSGVKNVYVGSVSTAQKTIKRLKGKKRYYVSIRAYKTVSKVKYYGAWSATKSVRTK